MLCAEEFFKNPLNRHSYLHLLEAFSNVNQSANSEQIRIRISSERGRMVLHRAPFHGWKSKHCLFAEETEMCVWICQ